VFSYLGKSGDSRATLYRPHVTGKLTAISFVTVGELLFGAAKGNWNKTKVERLKARIRSAVVVPYDREVCEVYAEIKASLPKGRTISDNDLWIAACAMRHSIPLITHNRRHFDDINGLVVISEQKVDTEIKSQRELTLEAAADSSSEQQPHVSQSVTASEQTEP